MTLADAIAQYLTALVAQGYAARTVDTYQPQLAAFAAWAETQKVADVRDVDLGLLRTYQAWLQAQTSRYGRPFSVYAQTQKLSVLRSLFAFLTRRGVTLVDAASDLELPRAPRRGLPYGLPTIDEMRRVIEAPDTTTLLGIRDRALLEVLYATAIRNAELRALRVWNVDLADQTLTVIRGKGQKDRVVPLGREAARWLTQYLTLVRPRWAPRRATAPLFLTSHGHALGCPQLNAMVKLHARRAGVAKRLTVHTFRHACASHMLRRGANLRHLQKLLGHRSLATTEVYTHVDIADLKRVHRKCHPRARRPRSRS